MQRRNLLIGMGSLTVGGAATIGTGAFTSVEAERSVTVDVAGDSNAYLGLQPTTGPNSDYVHKENGQVKIALSGSDNGGKGFNKNAVTEIDEMLKVTNQGTQTIYFWIEHPDSDPFNVDNFWFYTDDSPSTKLHNGDAGDGNDYQVLALSPGESAKLGVKADFGDVSTDASFDQEVTFYANSTKPEDSGPVESGGDDALVVSQNPNPENDNEFGSIQDAVDAAEGTTILVESGTYEESVSIDKPGLTIEGVGSSSTTIDASGKERGLDIKADGVTVRDLTVDSAGSGVEGEEVEGIFVGDANGFTDNGGRITIENVSITNVDGTDSGKTTEGIHVKHYDAGGEGDSIDGVTIENVTIDNINAPPGIYEDGGRGANGIKLQADISDINITNTDIINIDGGWGYGVTPTASGGQNGIPENVSFDGVTIDNVDASGDGYSSIGVGIGSASGNPQPNKVADPDQLSFTNTNIKNVDIGLVNKNTDKKLSVPEGVSFGDSVESKVQNPDGE